MGCSQLWPGRQAVLARPPASTRSHAFSVGLAAKVTLPLSELSAVPGLGWRTDSVSISSVHSVVSYSVTPWTAARQASLSLLEFTQTHVHRVGDAIQPSHPLSSPSPPALKSLLQHHNSKASILSVLSFLYSPTLTSIYDYWKNHS